MDLGELGGKGKYDDGKKSAK
ncbi:Protein of unknown function [Bacillus cereus]|nr:Protein of unknown function [Bacillus cereus]